MSVKCAWAVVLTLGIFSLTNCSQLSAPPTNDEVIKAVETDNHGTRNVVILEKGDRLKNGCWPYKVKYDIAGWAKDVVIILHICKEQNSMGQLGWHTKVPMN